MEERFIMDLLKKIKEIIEKLNTILQLMQIKYKLYLLQIMLMKLLMRIGNNKIIKLTKTERIFISIKCVRMYLIHYKNKQII